MAMATPFSVYGTTLNCRQCVKLPGLHQISRRRFAEPDRILKPSSNLGKCYPKYMPEVGLHALANPICATFPVDPSEHRTPCMDLPQHPILSCI
jgi:hypothetical protein